MYEHYEIDIIGDIEASHAFDIISRYKSAGFYQYMELSRTLEKEHITFKEEVNPKLCVRRITISRDTPKRKTSSYYPGADDNGMISYTDAPYTK